MNKLVVFIKHPLKGIKKFIGNYRKFVFLTFNENILKRMDDEKYLKLAYKSLMKKELDLNNPVGFNEKLQYLKLYDHNPLYTTLVDKIAVKEYISKELGEEYIIPTIGTWEKFDDIDFSKLPNKFVLKCNHDSGGLVICRDKNKLNMKKAK